MYRILNRLFNRKTKTNQVVRREKKTVIDVMREGETLEQRLHREIANYQNRTENFDVIQNRFQNRIENEFGGEEEAIEEFEKLFK